MKENYRLINHGQVKVRSVKRYCKIFIKLQLCQPVAQIGVINHHTDLVTLSLYRILF